MTKQTKSAISLAAWIWLATGGLAIAAAAKPKPKPAVPPPPAEPVGLLIPVPLDKAANFKVAGKLLADGNWLPAGGKVDDIPFVALTGEKDALDVSTSMANFKGGRIKNAYLTPDAGAKNAPPKELYGRLLMKVPADRYSAIHLLAFSQEKEGTVPRMTVRIGKFGSAAAILTDAVAHVPMIAGKDVPHIDDAKVVSRVPVKLPGGREGFISHMRISLGRTAELRELAGEDAKNRLFDLEFTRDLNTYNPVPDPSEFTQVPAGPASGVVILAATMERSPIDMTYTTAEAGNVFHEGQKAVFNFELTNRSDKSMRVRLNAVVTGPGTAEERPSATAMISVVSTDVDPGKTTKVPLDVTPKERGWYSCTVNVTSEDNTLLQQRQTSLTLLAPDTRKDIEESPFGVWCFWTAHNATSGEPNRNDKLASLMQKGGWRWTYGGHPAAPPAPGAVPGKKGGAAPGAGDAEIKRIREKYKLTFTVQSPPNAYQRGEGWWNADEFQKTVVPWLVHARDVYDNSYKVLHESRSSSALLLRMSEHLGGQPYDMPPEEKEKLDKQFEAVKQYCLAIKKADPNAKIVLINDQPPVANEYMKRKFPAEAFDVFGSEGAMFMREPERQPDWLSLLGTLQQLKRAQKQYGYDKPIWFTEALYHGTNPGNLSLHQQGVVSVREAMLALANGVQRMTSAGLIADSADDYHWSNWGACGFCFRDPEYNPKPSYAMYAWMTQVLDGTKYAGKISTDKGNDSTALHILDFKQRNGDGHIYPIWVPRGDQTVSLRVEGGTPIVYDVYGNKDASAKFKDAKLTVNVSDTPIYVAGVRITRVESRDTAMTPIPPTLVPPGQAGALSVVEGKSDVLEGNWDQPRLKGKFVVAPEVADGHPVLQIALSDDADPRKLLPRYVELKLEKWIELPKDATALTAHVKGNGDWTRIMFECVDAKGRIWTSCGNQHPGAANSSDCHGDSYISFDGWGTIRQALPGQYPGKDQAVSLPRNAEWWPTNLPPKPAAAEPATKPVAAAAAPAKPKRPGADLPRGDDLVDYPLRLTKIIVAMRPNVLYVDEERPVANRTLLIDAIGVESADK